MLAVRRSRSGGGGGHEITELRRGARIAPRILGRGAVVRAAFVAMQAGPLAGDRDSVRIVVGANATLVVEPVAATLALPGRARTLLALDVTVQAGGRLVLDEAPLIVAAGADVERRCSVELEQGAIAALRETVVLGRDGEAAGVLDSALRVTYDGAPLLHDGMRFGPAPAGHVALAPGHRVAGAACLLGMRLPAAAAAAAFELEGPGVLLRATGASLAVVDAAIAPTWRVWSGAAG